MKTNKTRILIVDDHPITTQGIRTIIDAEADMKVCGTAKTVTAAMRRFEKLKPDMAIIDLRLGDQSGLDLVHDLLIEDKTFPTLIFSMCDEALYAERAIRAGARGYVMKHEPAATILEAIRTVREGDVFLRPKLARQVMQSNINEPVPSLTDVLATLTDRELQVLQAMGDGYGRKEMAADINVSVKTLDGYRRSIMQKLGLRDTTELAQLAARLDEAGDI